MIDQRSNFAVVNALNSTAISSDTNTDGVEIDREEFESITFVAKVGAYTDGAYALAVLHGDTSGSLSVAPSSNLVATPAVSSLGAANAIATIGYVGGKKYVKLRVVSTSTSSGATLTGIAIKGNGSPQPVALG